MKKILLVAWVLGMASAGAGILDEKPAVWFRADRGVETDASGAITHWRNQGSLGSAIDLQIVSTNVGSKLTVASNGIGETPAVSFDGTSCLASANTSNLGLTENGGTWVAVFRSSTNLTARGNMGLFGLGSETSRLGAFYPILSGGNIIRSFFNGLNGGDTPATFAPKILVTSLEKTAGGAVTTTWLDGNQTASFAGTLAPETGRLFLGSICGFDWAVPFTGEFAELRVYNQPLSAAERQAMEGELSVRYGIPVGTNAAVAKLIRGVPSEQPYAQILWTKVLCKETDAYIGWPTITRRKNGEVLGVFSGDREDHVCPWGKVQMVRSTDQGESWSAPETVVNGPLDDRDAGILELANGDLVLTWFTSLFFDILGNPTYKRHLKKIPMDLQISCHNYYTMRSTDGGATWEKPVPTNSSTPHGPIQLRNGNLLMVGHAGPMTAMPKEDPRYGKQPVRVLAEISRDNGRSWEVLHEFTAPEGLNRDLLDEPNVVELPNGNLVAQFRIEDGSNVIWQSESADGGTTWSTVHRTPLLGLPPHMIVLKDGRLLTTYCCRLANRLGIYACVSDDGGMTWDVSREIKLCAHWEADMGYTSSVQFDDGTILTAYYMRDRQGEGCSLMGTKWRLK